MERLGISVRNYVGIGDGVQFTSLPENYYRAYGKCLIDVSRPWFFDHNPYVIRDEFPTKTLELWNYPKFYDWPSIRSSVYMSNAEVHASLFQIKNPVLNRPRLYRFEEFPYQHRKKILFHPFGRSHGHLPDFVIDHVLKKYLPTGELYQIGLKEEPSLGIPRIMTSDLWELARVISETKLFIGIDSGPSWIAACYPDVMVKKIRTQFQFGYCEPEEWIPLDVKNPHSWWDDRCFQIYNTFEDDVGFTYSYKKL